MPFSSAGNKFCGGCLQQIEKDYFVVRDFIYENKKSDVDTIAKETGVNKIVIVHLIREGRFYYEDINTSSAGVYKCKTCGKPAGSDKICNECKAKIALALQSKSRKKEDNKQPDPPQPKDKGTGMFFRRNSER
jgi:hypothetical protein